MTARRLIEMTNSVLLYFGTIEDEGYEVEGLAVLQEARAKYRGPGIVR
jgi:hypothetical protein